MLIQFRFSLIFINFKATSVKKSMPSKYKRENNEFFISNEFLRLKFDQNGNLNQIDNLETNVSSPISQVYCIYKSMPGNNSEGEFQASGAYVFRPQSNNCESLSVAKYSRTQGALVTEIHQIFNEWISQTIRLYKNRRHIEVDWLVGPINVLDQIGREIAIKFQTDLKSNGVFYTDSNGRETIKRVRDYRPTWKLNQTEPVSGNYYPINSRIFIRDEKADKTGSQFTVVTDRSQGGSSIQDGSIEIMLHRRTLYDDALGVAESLNEPGTDKRGLIVKGSLFLNFNTVERSAKVYRELAHLINNQPLTLFIPKGNDSNLEGLKLHQILNNLSFLGEISLPSNLHLLSLMRDFNYEIPNFYIIRIEHFYEIGEDSELSQPVTIDLKEILTSFFDIIGVKELALGANMDVEELNERLEWNSSPDLHFSKNLLGEFEKSFYDRDEKLASFEFSFEPMQIRTFRFWTV